MPICAAVHFFECLRQNSTVATKLESLAINLPLLGTGSNRNHPGVGSTIMASLISMTNLKTIVWSSEQPANKHCHTTGTGTYCNLSKGHLRALCIDVSYERNLKKAADAFKLALGSLEGTFRATFSILKHMNLLSDYGMTKDTQLVLPSFEVKVIRREEATRYRSGPYGTDRKKW